MARPGCEDLGLSAYLFEPEFTEEELAQMETQATDEDILTIENASQENNNMLSDITTWCRCNNGVLMATVIESNCCIAATPCRNKMPDDEQENCIINHPEFRATCLVRSVLDVIMTVMHELRGNVRPGDHSNRFYRLVAYRTYTWWLYGRRKLGFHVRKPIPSCVVHAIRNAFPEENNVYVGFLAAEFDDAWAL